MAYALSYIRMHAVHRLFLHLLSLCHVQRRLALNTAHSYLEVNHDLVVEVLVERIVQELLIE